MKAVSLFAGIGGFDLALKRTGNEVVFANEWDKYAAKVYEKNFGRIDTRDISKIPSSEIPKHDIICAGFPCQAFSIAGKRLGFHDTRGTLFREIMRIAGHCGTRYLLLENVKGLLSHDKGRTLAVILSTMDELGYDAEWQVLNSKDFGVPQNRERIFITGHLRGESWKPIFPITEGIARRSGEKREIATEITSALTARTYKGVGNTKSRLNTVVIDTQHSKPRVYDDSPTLSARMGTGGNNVPTVISHHRRTGNPKKGGTGILASNKHCFTLDSTTPHYIVERFPLKFMERNQKNIEGDYAYTVDSSQIGGIKINGRVRKLTPIECERLQSFPDNWTDCISISQRYKCLGNAVTVNVVEEILRRWQ